MAHIPGARTQQTCAAVKWVPAGGRLQRKHHSVHAHVCYTGRAHPCLHAHHSVCSAMSAMHAVAAPVHACEFMCACARAGTTDHASVGRWSQNNCRTIKNVKMEEGSQTE